MELEIYIKGGTHSNAATLRKLVKIYSSFQGFTPDLISTKKNWVKGDQTHPTTKTSQESIVRVSVWIVFNKRLISFS